MNIKLTAALAAVSFALLPAAAQNTVDSLSWDIYPDTWVGTDGAGRIQPTQKEAGAEKTDKKRDVGMFYVTWHTKGLHAGNPPFMGDVTKILEKDPATRLDGSSKNWGAYGGYHWGEPELGYFLSADPYVIRHDVSALADAGVDVLILDVTNSVRYWEEWEQLFKILDEMKSGGQKVPKFCFWVFNGVPTYCAQEIFERVYRPGRYKDLWYCRDGKPLLLYNADPSHDANGYHPNPVPNFLYDADAVTNPGNPHYGDTLYTKERISYYPKYILDFFSLRNMWWGYYKWAGKRFIGKEGNWTFGLDLGDKPVLDLTPRERASRHNGQIEEISVTPAQHPVSLIGKSWRASTGEPQFNEYDLPVATYVPELGKKMERPTAYGIYFQDRWDEALSIDPPFIYLNDWNEWSAGKYMQDPPVTFMRRKGSNYFFVDQYNEEFNRTIGPMKGGFTDNYYMQMAANIRKYKGARAIPQNYGIAPQGVGRLDASAWDEIKTEYRDTKGDITHRSYGGYGGLKYTDNLGRNDIVRSKVAVTSDSIYFYAETQDGLTACENDNWMLLFIDADNNHSTGWNGYDFVVNKNIEGNVSSVMSCEGEVSSWNKTAEARLLVSGNKLVVAVARNDLKLSGDNLVFDFKWVDNPRDFDSPIGLATAGDAAPNRRFNYRFIWHKDGSETVSARQKLIGLVEECNRSKLAESHAYGKNPGMVADSAVAARYAAAFGNAYSQASLELDDSKYEAAAEELRNAAEALRNAPVVPLSDGYYFIVSANPAYSGTTMAFDQTAASSKMLHWQELDEDKPNFVWKVTSADGGRIVQNLFSSQYINRSALSNPNSTIRLTDTVGAKQIVTPLNHAGQFAISNTVHAAPYYQKSGESGSSSSGYVTPGGEGGVSSCAAWRFVNADGYFIRNFKSPLDSVARLAKEKLYASVVIKDGSPDPLSPAFNNELKPYIDRLSQLLARDTLLDIHSITKAGIDTLVRAYESLLAVWPDTTGLSRVCAGVEHFLKSSTYGCEIGETSQEAYSALERQYAATIARRPFYAFTRREVDSLATELQKAKSYAEAAVNPPADEIWYNITSMDTTNVSGSSSKGECLYASSSAPASQVYWGGTPDANSRKVRSAWRFVSLGNGLYAVQNAGSGWYLGTSAKEGDNLRMSETPVAYRLLFVGDRQWALQNAESGMKITTTSKRRYTSLGNDSAGTNLPAAWFVSRIGTSDLRDSFNAVEGSLGVLALPYAQKALPQTVNGENMKLYVVCGSKLDASGKTISIDLSEYSEATVPAGFPLVYLAGGEYRITSDIPFHTFPETDGGLVTEAQIVNGLVGALKPVVIQNDTCGYFSVRALVPMTMKHTVPAQDGYVNATSIANIEGMNVDLTVNVSGGGLLNGISQTIRKSDETVDVYSVEGIMVRSGVKYSHALKGLHPGIYIIGDRKFVVK